MEWRHDHAERVYPHLHAAVPLDAVVSVADLRRAPDGRFLHDHEVA